MDIEDSEISCGVKQLSNVGECPTDAAYELALADHFESDGCAFLIASLPWTWKKSIKFLQSKGFKRYGGVRTNPNSGNKIVVLLKSFTEAERRKFIQRECRDCSTPVEGRRILCNDCRDEARRNRRTSRTAIINSYSGLRYGSTYGY